MYEIEINCSKCGVRHTSVVGLQNTAGERKCDNCDSILFVTHAVEGFVYVLSNEAMPGLVKVGMTSRKVDDRVSELNSATGVPTPFRVEAYFSSRRLAGDEEEAHAILGTFRIENKEFFKCCPRTAVDAIQKALGRGPVFVSKSLRRESQHKHQRVRGPDVGREVSCPRCGHPSPLPFSRVDVKCNHCGRVIPAPIRSNDQQ